MTNDSPLSAVRPFVDFEAACRTVLSHLHERLGFRLWMITRTQDDDWTILSARDEGYGVREGEVLRWSDSFCARMVAGEGPCIAPSSDDVSAYAEAPIGDQIQIRAYVGMPLLRSDGTLFGTLCAIDPEPQPEAIVEELPTVRLMARLLATLLETELAALDDQRRVDRTRAKAERDELTGLVEPRSWERLIEAEEIRSRAWGNPVGIVRVRLDPGDDPARQVELRRRAATVMRDACRDNDLLARLGNDDLGVLAVDCRPPEVEQLGERLGAALDRADLGAAVAWASRRFGTLRDAVDRAGRKLAEPRP